ncbi:hypothetical protein ATE67_11530 [Sphingopyxis sp. H050]|jgi:hypothetical protein|nr:hypothetical protein ATE67_11530 [Sphingopyxis sp. H050]
MIFDASPRPISLVTGTAAGRRAFADDHQGIAISAGATRSLAPTGRADIQADKDIARGNIMKRSA